MPAGNLNAILRSLPSVEEVLNSPAIVKLADKLPRPILTDAIRDELDDVRAAVIATKGEAPVPADIPTRAAKRAMSLLEPSLRRVINASGVIIHTNLGRSVMAKAAVDAVVDVARGYSTLEYSVEGMCRGSRHDHCEQLICMLTGAEAALAVNNNAAAAMMVLSEFASGHEAVVSRGELVEIGGSFRIPDIMEMSGATMREVGTTNKTHDFDFERAITDDTAMLLKVHTSNYRLVGFTESVTARELRRIADEAAAERARRGVTGPDILVYEDLGSGALLDLENLGDFNEPTAGEALGGCDLVSFSGDKLLGGPQAGIIIGSKALIDRLKKNPLARALRLDKMTLAALEATLRIYLDPERARREIPTLAMLNAPAEQMEKRAEALAHIIKTNVGEDAARIEVVPEISRAGGGALPMRDIPTFCVQVTPCIGSAQECEEYLVRENHVPVIARIKQEALLFDTRTLIDNDEFVEIAQALAAHFRKIANAR